MASVAANSPLTIILSTSLIGIRSTSMSCYVKLLLSFYFNISNQKTVSFLSIFGWFCKHKAQRFKLLGDKTSFLLEFHNCLSLGYISFSNSPCRKLNNYLSGSVFILPNKHYFLVCRHRNNHGYISKL